MSKNFIERPHKNEKENAIAYVQELLKHAREDRRNKDVEKLENLLRLINTKKYGLIWEEHAELVEEEMKTKIPVFVEDETKKILGNLESEDYNFLLEGDNLHSLHLLKKTHAGKIDVIYIDPPYNTGNKDFIYNDKIVDKNDGYSHSKWLSFMSKRLEIARELLSEKGVIFISIDDNEQAQLKLLCDEIFGEHNFENFVWQKKNGPGNTEKVIGNLTEFLLCYFKKKKSGIFNYRKIQREFKYSDAKGKYNLEGIEKTNLGMYERPTMVFAIVDDDTGNVYYPSKNMRWTIGKETVEKFKIEKKLFFDSVKKKVYRIKRSEDYAMSKNVYLNLLVDLGSLKSAKDELAKLIGNREIFSTPKPTKLIEHILKITTKKNAIILDFFAGSGTTGHAVVQLNKEDNGNRKYILCTNNESNICEEVTYKRLSNIQNNLPHNLKYFKTNFVDKIEFPDVTLEYELLNYVTPLVELEFGVDISNPKVQVILSEEQLDEMTEMDFIENSILFIHPEIFFDAKQEQIFRKKNIKKQEIPNYYFGKDIWS